MARTDGVKLEARHLAMWARAHPATRPAKGEEKPPTYGAWHRQRADKRRDGATIEPVSDETPGQLEKLAGDGE